MASQSFKGILSGNVPETFEYPSRDLDREYLYEGPQESNLLPGQHVRFVNHYPPPADPLLWKMDQESIARFKRECGEGPYEVVRTTKATKTVGPQVTIRTNTSKPEEKSYGAGWFKRVLVMGDICPVCWRAWTRREMFFSTYIGCHCPEKDGDER